MIAQMIEQPSVATVLAGVVAGIFLTAIPTVVGWLVIRAVKSVDVAIGTLAIKVDALIKQDTQTQVDVADLRARVVHLEHIVHVRRKTS